MKSHRVKKQKRLFKMYVQWHHDSWLNQTIYKSSAKSLLFCEQHECIFKVEMMTKLKIHFFHTHHISTFCISYTLWYIPYIEMRTKDTLYMNPSRFHVEYQRQIPGLDSLNGFIKLIKFIRLWSGGNNMKTKQTTC